MATKASAEKLKNGALGVDDPIAAELSAALQAAGYSGVHVQDISERRTDVLLWANAPEGAKTPLEFFEADRPNPRAKAVCAKLGIEFREIALSAPRLVLRDVKITAQIPKPAPAATETPAAPKKG